MLCPVPTPRRPGDPHARGRGPGHVTATLVALGIVTAAPVAAAAVDDTSHQTIDCFVQVIDSSPAAAPSPTGPSVASPGPTAPTTPTSPATAPTSTSPTTAPTSTSPAPTTAPTSTSPAPTTAPTSTSPAPTTAPASTSPAPTTAPASTSPATATPTSAATPATTPATASKPAAEIRTPASKPPRVDGPYIGGMVGGGGSFARVNNFETPDPMPGGSLALRFGQAIYPWMTIGLGITGTLARRFAEPSQRLLQGAVLVDFGFLPVPRIPLSLHVGFGAGGGAVREAGRSARSGFGGAVFTGAVRYEIFPLAARKRPRRGGGFSLGPELGWLGFTPAAKGRPMSNTVYLGLFMGFYFGS